jgi:hypothetical protein
MPTTPYLWIPLTILLMVLGVISLRRDASRLEAMIDSWARANNLTVLSKERRLLLMGPMIWRTGRTQRVFRIKVRDQHGRQRAGWVRCGGRWTGLYSDQVEARWDT